MTCPAHHLALLLAVLVLGPALTEAALDCKGGEERTENPIGTCTCDGHLWVSIGCQEGYYCMDTTGSGCYLECEDGFMVNPDFSQDTWECLEANIPSAIKADQLETDYVEPRKLNVCPANGYDVCPSTNTDPPPVDVTANPLGTCRCNSELWIAESCTYGFKCDTREEFGGEYLSCDPGEILHVDETDYTWSCVNDNGGCPGGFDGIGCEIPDCDYSVNPFGECECDGQMLINGDCSVGFYCQTNIPDPYLYDGCIKQCLEGEVLVPNFRDNSWECLDDAMPGVYCPGAFSLQCPENDIGHGFDSSICECNGQLHVSGDCQESFHCIAWLANGGRNVTCPDGEIVDYDPGQTSWRCTSDVDNCPGQGGFIIGCEQGGVVTPELDCEFDTNPFGTCGGCEGQIFISDDCRESFYCSLDTPDSSMEGCHLTCENNERVHIDYATNTWECVDRENSFICPGRFEVDCSSDTAQIECHCKNELWMDNGCTSAFICDDKEGANGISMGAHVGCPDPDKPYLKIDFTQLPNYECVADPDVCPNGSFHIGCVGDDFIPVTYEPWPTTDEPPPTTEPATTNKAPVTTNEVPVTEPITEPPTTTEEPPPTETAATDPPAPSSGHRSSFSTLFSAIIIAFVSFVSH